MSSAVRRFLPQSEMHAIFVVLANIVCEKSLEVALVEGDDMVEQVTPTAFHPTLCHAILPRTLQRSADPFDFHRSDRGWDIRPILGIPVEDEKPGCRPKGKGLPELLHDPTARRVSGDIDVQDAAAIVANDEKAIEHAKRDRWNREEIHCRDSFPVVAQKRKPTLGQLGISRRPTHPAGDRSLGNIKIQHEKFTMDARGTPRGVLLNHPEDQILNLF